MAEPYAASLAGPELDAYLDDLADMIAKAGRHATHRLRQDGPHVVCSCGARVQADLATVRAQFRRPTQRPTKATPPPATAESAATPPAAAPAPPPPTEASGHQHATHQAEHDRQLADAPWVVVLPGGARLPAASVAAAERIAGRHPGALIEETTRG